MFRIYRSISLTSSRYIETPKLTLLVYNSMASEMKNKDKINTLADVIKSLTNL